MIQVLATAPDGNQYDLSNTYPIEGLRFSTAMPGGCHTLTVRVKVKVGNQRYPWSDLFTEIEVYDVYSGTCIWYGRVLETPRGIEDGEEYVELQASGPYHDELVRKKYRQVWKDQDATEWVLTQRDLNNKYASDDNNRQYFSTQGGRAYAVGSAREFRYKMQGSETVKRLDFTYRSVLGTNQNQWVNADGGTVWMNTATGSVTGTVSLTSGMPASYVDHLIRCTSAATGVDGSERWCQIDTVTVWGTSGSARPSDVIVDTLTAVCTDVSSDYSNVASSSVALPHLAIHDYVTVAQIIDMANKYDRWDFAVWGDRKAYYNTRDTTVSWYGWLSMGLTYNVAPSGMDLADEVYVTYDSSAETDFALMHEVVTCSSASPALDAAGIGAQAVVETPFTNSTAASAAGVAFLSEYGGDERPTGTITCSSGQVLDANLSPARPWMMKAGQNIQIPDLVAPDDFLSTTFDAQTTGRIAMTEWDDDSQTMTLTLDASYFTFDAMMERLADQKKPNVWTLQDTWCPYHKRYHTRAAYRAEIAKAKRLKLRWCAKHKRWETRANWLRERRKK